jgi:hypothetical protein
MAQEQRKPTEDWSQPPIEYFSDVFWTSINPWSASITFGLRKAGPEEADTPNVRMRMPLQQAKALAVILLRTVRQYETQANVTVELPRSLLDSLGIPLEDWQRFTEA